MKVTLLNKEYEEAAIFPDTTVEETNECKIDIYNPHDSPVQIECIPEDKDVTVKFCPKTLEARKPGIVILEYAPKADRSKTLSGSKVRFKVTL